MWGRCAHKDVIQRVDHLAEPIFRTYALLAEVDSGNDNSIDEDSDGDVFLVILEDGEEKGCD